MQLETILETREKSIGWRIFSHLFFWLFYFGTNLYYNSISFNPIRDSPFLYLTPMRTTLGFVLLYYPLVYWIGLRLLYRKTYVRSGAAFAGLFLLYAVLDYEAEMLILQHCRQCVEELTRANASYLRYLQGGLPNVVFSRIISLGLFFGFVYNLTLPLAIKLTLSYYRKHVESLKLSRDNIQLELNFLKSQVNPHFLFNTLNNLYGLIIHERKEQSAETVARLSEFMRYSLYESNQEHIPLEKEIGLLKSYIQLEQLRLNHTKVIFEYSVEEKQCQFPPLLFMPMVENAFKFSPDHAESRIFIKLEAKEGIVRMNIKNHIQACVESKTSGGIGLSNLRKRLSIHFPNRHQLEISDNGKEYSAHLSIQLNTLR